MEAGPAYTQVKSSTFKPSNAVKKVPSDLGANRTGGRGSPRDLLGVFSQHGWWSPILNWGLSQFGERPLANRLYSDDASLILRRDLARPLVPRPRSKIPIRIRPIERGDFAEIIVERPRRLPALRANIPTCYVATTEDGSICYMQWLIPADQQDRLRPFFKGELAGYDSDTVLLEFAYTFEGFRGQRVMAAAMAEIAEQGLLLGARWAITYVKHDNIASLKGCAHAGFRPYMLRTESWRAFRLHQTFRVLAKGTPYSFELESAANRPASSD